MSARRELLSQDFSSSLVSLLSMSTMSTVTTDHRTGENQYASPLVIEHMFYTEACPSVKASMRRTSRTTGEIANAKFGV